MLADQGLTGDGFGLHVPKVIEIRPETLLRIQGYRDMSQVRDDVRAYATDMSERAKQLVQPEAHYRRARVDHCGDGLLKLACGATFHGHELTQVLEGCQELIVFVLTLGPNLDDESIRMLGQEDVVEALFLETAGWIAIEQATRDLARHLQSSVSAAGLRLTRRTGPGYADWPLEEQSTLFQVMAGAPHKITLLESFAMLPKKSRSGVYGLKPAA
ncbi:MAG: hypothetical protein AAF495_15305 [Pseudomonadota bacterium]